MEKVVLYVSLTDEENKALNSEEIESVLNERTTQLLSYAEHNKYQICGVYRDGFYLGDSNKRLNLNLLIDELQEKAVNLVLTTYDEIISDVKDTLDNFISKLNDLKVNFKSITKRKPEDTLSNRRNQQLKQMMASYKLEYVSPCIINLLELDIENDERFLNQDFEIIKRSSFVREIYNSNYNWYGKSVILYVRLSEEDKNKKTPEELSESIKNQLSMLIKHAKKINGI